MAAHNPIRLSRIRESTASLFCVRLLVLILAAGAVSPGWVWCHAPDGHVSLEYEGLCSLLPIGKSMSHATSIETDLPGTCEGCVDEPVFNAEANWEIAQSELSLASGAAFVSVDASVPTSNPQPLIWPSQDIHKIDPTLTCLRSTVLVI